MTHATRHVCRVAPPHAVLASQALAVAVVATYSAAVMAALCAMLRRLVDLRVNLEDEIRGVDLADHDEAAYEWLRGGDGDADL